MGEQINLLDHKYAFIFSEQIQKRSGQCLSAIRPHMRSAIPISFFEKRFYLSSELTLLYDIYVVEAHLYMLKISLYSFSFRRIVCVVNLKFGPNSSLPLITQRCIYPVV